jgi:hypothetical protein
MRDEEFFTRYDRIRFSEAGDRFDPFNMAATNQAKNSYLGENIWLNGEYSVKKSIGPGSSIAGAKYQFHH